MTGEIKTRLHILTLDSRLLFLLRFLPSQSEPRLLTAADFEEPRLRVILDYAKGLRCTNTYQFHFFVLPTIFMPSPAAPYLCSQLASVTKGLCKPLLPANRFLPTSEETAADAAAYLSARHAPKHVCLFSFFLVFPFFFLLPPLVLEALSSQGR